MHTRQLSNLDLCHAVRDTVLTAHRAGGTALSSVYRDLTSASGEGVWTSTVNPKSRNSFSLNPSAALIDLHAEMQAFATESLGMPLLTAGDQVLIYEAGGFFKPHWDTGILFKGKVHENAPHREYVCILYLSNQVDSAPQGDYEFTGGELRFCNTGEKVRAATGLMVLFNGTADDKHEVLKITQGGYRIALTRWFKAYPAPSNAAIAATVNVNANCCG